MTKPIDRWRFGGIGSARRHDGGRPRDSQSIEVQFQLKPPGWLFSPLETSSLTVWLSVNRAGFNDKLQPGNPKQIGYAEKRKKIKLCAARRYLRVCQKVLSLETTMRGSRTWKQGPTPRFKV